jgi:hypothetical protein
MSSDKNAPGKYDNECNALLKQLDAEMILVGVGGGSRGNGFSLSIDRAKCPCPACVLAALAETLRSIADQIEVQYNQAPHTHAPPSQGSTSAN